MDCFQATDDNPLRALNTLHGLLFLQLCNHPKILVEGSASGVGRDSGLAEVVSFLPTASASSGGGIGFGYGRRGGGGIQKGVFPEWSGCVCTKSVRGEKIYEKILKKSNMLVLLQKGLGTPVL